MENKSQSRLFYGILIGVILIVIIFLYFVSAITINNISPISNITTNNVSQEIYINFSSDSLYLNATHWNWDSVNYYLWKGLISWWQMNNLSSLGENSNKIVDISGNGVNLTVSTAVFNLNGRFNGGYENLGETGVNSFSNSLYNSSSEMTFCFWIKPQYKYATDWQNIMQRDGIGYGNQPRYNEIIFYMYNGSKGMAFSSWKSNLTSSTCDVADTPTYNSWNFYCGIATNTIFYLYKNSNLVGSGSCSGDINLLNATGTFKAMMNFNGTLDEVMIYNRSLSSSEIKQLYYSSLTKYDSQNWTFYSNQTLDYSSSRINASSNTYINNYNLCVNNGTEVCSSTNQIIQTLPIRSAVANFTNSIGIVRNNFYGVGLQSPKILSGTILLPNGTNVNRNYTWQQETLLNSGAKIVYLDANLGSYYHGLNNLDFEWWSNTSVGFQSSGSMGVFGWAMGWGGGRNATIYADTNAYSGTYALAINSSVGSGHLYPHRNIKVVGGRTYNFSAWVKGQGTGVIECFNSAFTDYHTTSFTMTSSWQQVSVICTPIANDSNEFIAFEGFDNYENISIDDFNVTENGVQMNWWRVGDTTTFENQLTWDYQNNISDMIIMSYMPSFLANITLNGVGWSNCINNYSDGDTADCMYNNKITWNEINLDFYKRVDQGRNRTGIQIWNEPEGGFFEDNLADSSAKIDFVTLFNETYINFKNYNSNIDIFGYRGVSSSATTTGISAFTRMMLSNLSSEFKNFGYHPYDWTYIDSSSVGNEITYLKSQCDLYGAECSYILLDEWQPTSQTLKNQSSGLSNQYKANIAYFLIDLLNNYPANVTEIPYHWDDEVSYFKNGSRYSEYPSFWSSVSEAGLDNESLPVLYPAYTVPRYFSILCPPLSTVKKISLESPLKGLSCQIGNTKNIILINPTTNSYNISINLTSSGITTLSNYLDNTETFTASGNTNLGIMDSYDIKYLTEDLASSHTFILKGSNRLILKRNSRLTLKR